LQFVSAYYSAITESCRELKTQACIFALYITHSSSWQIQRRPLLLELADDRVRGINIPAKRLLFVVINEFANGFSTWVGLDLNDRAPGAQLLLTVKGIVADFQMNLSRETTVNSSTKFASSPGK
jgi:hypothetical protein